MTQRGRLFEADSQPAARAFRPALAGLKPRPTPIVNPAVVLIAVVVVVLGLVGCRHQPAASQPGDPMLAAIRSDERAAGLTYAEAQGRMLFLQYCATCHGDEGRGDGQNASNLNPKPADLTASKTASDAALVRRVITQGSASIGRSPLSPPWGRNLRPQQVDELVLYCTILGRKKPG